MVMNPLDRIHTAAGGDDAERLADETTVPGPLLLPELAAALSGTWRAVVFLAPPAVVLALGAALLGWTIGTLCAWIAPGRLPQPIAVAMLTGRFTLLGTLGCCISVQGLRLARTRWRAPIRFF